VKLFIVAGFLGSGKTTLILHLAMYFTNQKKKKVAIIENEIGQIGIDNQYLELEGLRVQELQSGCICCSMSFDLLETLKKLHDSFHPEVVLIEPSGVANPEKVLETISHSVIGIAEKKVIVLLDALRFKPILAAKLPFVQKGLEVAHIVVINKIDEIGKEALQKLISEVRTLTQSNKIFPISLEKGTGLLELMKEVG